VPRAMLHHNIVICIATLRLFWAPSLQVTVAVEPCNPRSVSGVVRNTDEIERAVKALANSANGGLIVTPSAGVSVDPARAIS
jgi:hypothetical protein